MSSVSAIFSQFLQPKLLPGSPNRRSRSSRIPVSISVLKSSRPVSEIDECDVLRDFLKDRTANGDFIARISDRIWLRDLANVGYAESETGPTDGVRLLEEVLGEENEGGFLKLRSTRAWLSGEASAPLNVKRTVKELPNDSERRLRLNFLRYEALKRDLLFLTVSIGTACSGYCLLALSPQAALSYTTGVFFRSVAYTFNYYANMWISSQRKRFQKYSRKGNQRKLELELRT